MGVVGEARKDPFFGSPPSAWPTRASPPQPKGLPLTPIAVPCSGGCGRERSPGDGSRLRRGMQNKSLPDGTGATFRSSRGSRLSAASSSSSSPLLQASLLSRPGQAPFPGKQLEIPPLQHPSPNLVVLRPCQPGCDFCPSGAGTEVLWRPPGYVPAPGLSTHPGLWLPGYEQRWCGPTGCTLAGIAPSQDPLLSYTATWEANPYDPASQPV